MDIKKVAISGTKWTAVSTIITASIQVLRLSILTRFLDKSDFGIVAILTFVLGLTNTFADLGFSAAIMHKQDISRNEFSSLYWIQFVFFTVLFVIFCFLSPFISLFYAEESITYLLPIVLLDLIFNGVGRLYDTLLQKNFQFRLIALRNIISSIISIFVALLLAIWGCGIYSLIFSTLFNTIVFNIWNFISGQKLIRLKFKIDFRESFALAKIGLFQTGTQIIDYIAAKFDILIIGKFLGTENLGIYNLAKELVMKVILLINSIANKVILPIFSKVQNDPETLRNTYCKVLTILSSVNFPISVIISVLSPQIVAVLYGKGYEDVGLLMSILSLWSLFLCIGNPVGSIAIATGKTNLSFYYTLVRFFLTIPILLLASMFDIKIVAWSNVLMAVIMFFVAWRMLLRKMIGLSLKRYYLSFHKPFVTAIILGVPMYLIKLYNLLNIGYSSIVNGCIYGILLIALYGVVYYKFYGKEYFINLK